MSAAKAQRARRETVVLTHQNIMDILVGCMGWEPEDVDVFWQLARRETLSPGITAQRLRCSLERAFGHQIKSQQMEITKP